jgi:hypothetical protein
MATVLQLPASTSPFARPGPGATPQQVANYHYQMLVADGAIPSASYSPLEPGAHYFYGRAPRNYDPFASASPFPEEAFAQPLGRGPLAFAEGRQGWGVAIYEGDGPTSLVFGPRRAAAPRAEDEDALIAQNISEAEQKLLDSLAGSADDGEDFIKEAQRGEEFIQEHAQLMREAQRLRGVVPTEPDTDLEAALALSAQLAADTDSAALEEGLTLSQAVADTAATPANTDESAEAGVDIPFTTPSTLVDDTSSSSASSAAAGTKGECSQIGAAATSKQGSGGKDKSSKGKGAQV